MKPSTLSRINGMIANPQWANHPVNQLNDAPIEDLAFLINLIQSALVHTKTTLSLKGKVYNMFSQPLISRVSIVSHFANIDSNEKSYCEHALNRLEESALNPTQHELKLAMLVYMQDSKGRKVITKSLGRMLVDRLLDLREREAKVLGVFKQDMAFLQSHLPGADQPFLVRLLHRDPQEFPALAWHVIGERVSHNTFYIINKLWSEWDSSGDWFSNMDDLMADIPYWYLWKRQYHQEVFSVKSGDSLEVYKQIIENLATN